MDALVLGLLTFSLLLIIGGVVVAVISGRSSSKPEDVPLLLEEEEVRTQPGSRAARGGTGRMRQRRGRSTAATATAVTQVYAEEREAERAGEEEGGEGEGEGEEEDEEGQPGGKYYKAKGGSKKDSKKKEKQARREAEQAAREAKSEKSGKYVDRQRQKELEREEEERMRAAELAEFEAKQAAEAAAELDQWKGLFSVETEGTVEQDVQEESQGLLQNFVDHIKKHKCVALEDLAAEFGLRAQDVVNRVVALEQMGRISGVMDDRGKFIYISTEEMKAVADYIQRTGRVSISHLASTSNKFIDLEPKVVEQMESIDEPWSQGGGNGIQQAQPVLVS